MQRDKKLRAIRRILGHEEITKGDEVVFICPRQDCGHRKPKLSVNLATDWFHCWICEWSGKNLVPILRLKGDNPELQEYLGEIQARRISKTEEPEKKYDTPVLPKEFVSLSTHSRSPYFCQAMEYLASRGVSTDDILRMKLGYCEDGEYKYRIIFPSFDEHGELNFFTGRTYQRHPLPYKHGNFNKDIIFNEYLVDWTEPVVITEGPFDALKAGENAIPLQGSILREGSKLFQKIVSLGVDTYFAMDTDAFQKQLEVIKLFRLYGVNCYHIRLFGKKDVGEMSRQEFIHARSKAFAVRNDLDFLRLRMLA